VVILALVLTTALVHLDKAIMLSSAMGHHAVPPPGTHAGAAGSHGGAAGRVPLALPLPLPVLFFLNFLGYIVLGAALYAPLPLLRRYQRLIRWLLIAYTAVTILAYIAIVGEAPNALGAFDKAIELALIVFLLIEDRYLQVTRGQAARGQAARGGAAPGRVVAGR
jgi:hypothetical protein